VAFVVYFDASALVKRYTVEVGTDRINEIFHLLSASRMRCSVLGALEVVSILTRKRNDGRIDQQVFLQARKAFRAEVFQAEEFSVITVNDSLVLASVDLLEHHNLNSTDAIILRSALDFQQTLQAANDTVMLCASDKRLVRAAGQEGLLVVDPEQETMEYLRQLLAS
jgi:predicted nucleic acid-binding protein